jgi:hypothetical protein
MRLFRWALLLLFAVPSLAGAQSVTATTGSINGKITDGTGAVLPGVTVTVSSPSMQGTRTASSGVDGSYRFAAVPPGEYRVSYELSGFSNVVREGIRVSLGFTATINVEMNVATLQETVTVSGESPVVDVSSTTTSTNFDYERLAALPNARDFWAVLAAAPAIQVQRIDVGGSAAGTQTAYYAYDTKADQHRPMVEGIVNTEGTNAAGWYYDYGSVEEVSIGTATHGAEMPTPGVLTQFISKSGGNQYHGRVYYDYQNEAIQARNIEDTQINLCPGGRLTGCGNLTPSDLNRMTDYHDINADIGGFLRKDKVWWYFSVRDQNIKSLLPNFPVKPFETGLRNVTGKATYALSQNNKLIGYAGGGRKSQPNRMDTFRIAATVARHETEESTWQQLYWGHTYKGEWNSVLSDSVFFETRVGQFKYEWPNFRYTEAPAYQDIATNLVTGGNRDGWFNIPERNQWHSSLSYFKDNWAGSHNFKIGGELLHETFTYLRGEGVDGVVPGDVIHYLNNGNPQEVDLFQTPSNSENGLWTIGAYIQDTWRVSNRLTLNVGVRLDRYRSFLPEQEGPPVGRFNTTQLQFPAQNNLFTWNLPAPRLGATFDLFGTGKTVFKVNWGQYWWNPGTGIAENVNENPPDWRRRHRWSDLNGDRLWQPGEEGQIIQQFGGAGSSVLDPDLEDTRTDEFATWLDHELMPNFGLHAGYVYRRIGNFRSVVNQNRPFDAFNVPVTIRDPGPDGSLGNADDGPSVSGFNLSESARLAPVVNLQTNGPGTAEYHNFEISGTRRQTGWWSLHGSFTMRWNRDVEDVYFGNRIRPVTADFATNPNDTINTDDGRLHFTTWSAKLSGTIDAPFELRITPAIRHQSGQPYGRVFLATMNYGTQQVLAEPISARRQDNVNVVDIRVERVITIRNQRLSPFFDVYNLSNNDAATNINWNSGANFELPSTIIGPRIMRFGIKYDW